MRHGPLDNFSAFPFESFLQRINRTIRANGKCLEQIVRRMAEEADIRESNRDAFQSSSEQTSKNRTILLKQHDSGPLADLIGQQYHVAYIDGMCIRVSKGDS